ncbi:BAG domain-containing protein Samui-like isoform X1 [Polistes fuscatus]|uniref:BAG domain-containing protein Samui-like isoform X1 n=1 Tax=Polistes fuscatus TaxID=30207 RepID=UPI001CA9413D|nr:BAG domain-containing protein Samui-like isoform X1 [Polistes fuscatus]
MSFYFRDKPRFGERFRGKSGDKLLQEIQQQLDEDSKSFFEPTTNNKSSRFPFDRRPEFPKGFPFDDDDDFGRRTDIRAHLDDLAARHPEFADHLLGPPWGDIPFRGSTYNNQRRGSGNGGSSGSSSYPNYPDEDARSQASGSSATSAASGASGVSSHGDPESSSSSSNRSKNQQYNKQSHREDRRNPIPQYGLRNTVDIGQHHRDNMENSEKDSRGQRSMSAPPENRQQTNLQQEQDKSQQQPGQRFVSRVDITPQHNQPQSSPSQQQSSPPPPPPPTQQSQGNVRHIPIFVEGRDEPVISRNIDSPFQRQQSPPHFHNSSHFTKPSSFSNLGFGPRQWRPPHFQESFYNPNSSFDHSPTRRTQQSPNYQQPKQYAERQRNEQQPPRHHQYESQPQEYHQPRQRARQQQEPKPHPQQQTAAPGQQAQQQEAPKHVPKQTLPKDPLERVALVQKEVDSLAEQVKQYTGNSRKDKQYMFLDEMLTRELIKLDDIETEGRENVRQARKNAIRTIQETISLLESKAPLSGQEQSQEDLQSMQVEQYQEEEKENQPSNESMDVDQNNEQNIQSNEAIPLPPGPSSPKATTESNEVAVAQIEQQNVSTENQQMEQEQEVPPAANQAEQKEQQQQQEVAVVAEKPSNENTNNITEVTMQIDSSAPMEVQEKVENVVEEDKKDENQNLSKEIKMEESSVEQKSTGDNKQISDSQEKIKGTSKSPLSPKTVKKAKKQAAPISEKAIPLPPPESTEADAK